MSVRPRHPILPGPYLQSLPADLPGRLSTVDATVVVDHAGFGSVQGAPGDTVHPWSAAGMHAYTWIAGGAPAAATDVVLTAPTAHRPGDRIVTNALGWVPLRCLTRHDLGALSSAAMPTCLPTDRLDHPRQP